MWILFDDDGLLFYVHFNIISPIVVGRPVEG